MCTRLLSKCENARKQTTATAVLMMKHILPPLVTIIISTYTATADPPCNKMESNDADKNFFAATSSDSVTPSFLEIVTHKSIPYPSRANHSDSRDYSRLSHCWTNLLFEVLRPRIDESSCVQRELKNSKSRTTSFHTYGAVATTIFHLDDHHP